VESEPEPAVASLLARPSTYLRTTSVEEVTETVESNGETVEVSTFAEFSWRADDSFVANGSGVAETFGNRALLVAGVNGNGNGNGNGGHATNGNGTNGNGTNGVATNGNGAHDAETGAELTAEAAVVAAASAPVAKKRRWTSIFARS
jgi:hypothetical protein